ncbi:hypothetical protein RGU70_17045 [Herbaspirillum sp. RTI4]|uniref:hypothetical protein n=1 Tax=Herbaspirillum sp. RTI4 TaxID=3048640 RepID=UPI002AB32CCC|nr:hypothetical protein [Herbaspirillum sp. RTI4]MDY7580021.1 hypothetical protein [Herbaspirillum sp. RTI4]
MEFNKNDMSGNSRYFQWIVLFLAMIFPSLILIHSKVGNFVFYCLLLAGVLRWVVLRGQGRGNEVSNLMALLKNYWPLHLAMAGTVLAIFINQTAHGHWYAKTYDYPSRMFFFPLILWALLALPASWMKQMRWAFVVGAILATIKMYVTTKGGTDREYVYFMPIIEFAQMSLLLGFFSILSIALDASQKNGQ